MTILMWRACSFSESPKTVHPNLRTYSIIRWQRYPMSWTLTLRRQVSPIRFTLQIRPRSPLLTVLCRTLLLRNGLDVLEATPEHLLTSSTLSQTSCIPSRNRVLPWPLFRVRSARLLHVPLRSLKNLCRLIRCVVNWILFLTLLHVHGRPGKRTVWKDN